MRLSNISTVLAIGCSVIMISAVRLPGATIQRFKVKVVAEQANLRERPDIGSAILQMIPEGTILEADKKEGEWYLVRYTLEDGGVIAGYIHESLVSVAQEARPVSKNRGQEPQEAATRPDRATPAGTARPQRGSRRRTDPDIRISFSGGWSRILGGDLNGGAKGFADYYGASLGVPPQGSIGALHSTLHAGFELAFQIIPRLYLGVATEVLEGSQKSGADYAMEPVTGRYTAKPGIRAIPAKVTLAFYPLRSGYVKAAFGYYFVSADYYYRTSAGPLDWQEWKARTTSQGLGVEGTAGGEWDLSPRLVFFAEAGARYVKINRFVGKETYSDAFTEEQLTNGTLYHFLKTGSDLQDHALLFVRETTPTEEGVVEAREAEVDLSGIVLRIGLRIRF